MAAAEHKIVCNFAEGFSDHGDVDGWLKLLDVLSGPDAAHQPVPFDNLPAVSAKPQKHA
jgi:hypothetical protein